MSSSPFEDPEVQKAQNTYGNSAYNDTNTSGTMNNAYNDVAVNVAASVAESTAKTVAQGVTTDYQKQMNVQADHNAMPEPPNWCIRIFNWIPIRWFAFIGGMLLILLPIVEIINKTSAINFLVYVYMLAFGFLTMFVELPTFVATRKIQLGIYFWFRLLARAWGRAWFYIFVSILCFRLKSGFSIFVGIWMLVIAFAMFIYSKLAANKYVRIYIFIAAGKEGDELKQRFEAKFDELDLDRDQRIGSLEIVKLAGQAGRTLSNAERHLIQTFLDDSCNGSVSKEDWWKQFSTYNLKQRFL